MDEEELLRLLRTGWHFPGVDTAHGAEIEPAAGHNNLIKNLLQSFARIYGSANLLTGPSGQFPVATFPTRPGLSLRDLVTPSLRRPAIYQTPPRLRIERRAGWWDSATYALGALELDTDGKIKLLHQSLGTYGGMVASADYLELEALAAAVHGAPDLGAMPYRHRILSESSSPMTCLLSGGGVVATIGISVMLIYARDGQYWALFERRPKRVGPPTFMYHVVPAMLHQPTETRSGTLEHANLEDSIFREYLEELFGMPEPHEHRSDSALEQVAAHPNFIYLRNLIETRRARLECLGIAINLLNHRPDVCALLYIDDEDWYLRHASSLSLSDWTSDSQNGFIASLPLSSSHWPELLRSETVSPPGAAAIVMGMNRAFEILEQPLPGWLLDFAPVGAA